MEIPREEAGVPYERVRGKRHQLLGLEFGKKLFFKHKEGPKKAKMLARWQHGIFVGVRRKSHEVIHSVYGGWNLVCEVNQKDTRGREME